jgi:FkbM family methyltransferase
LYKLVKLILNGAMSLVFIFLKDNFKKAKIYTWVSKLLFDKDNNLEYDPFTNGFWLKDGDTYLFFVKKPYFNFSKKNLYLSILDIYCKHYVPSQGDTIIDVGAGIGTETLYFFEHVGNKGQIYSIEASTDSYNKLDILCKKNKINNSINHNLAISNFNGKIWIEETEHFEVNRINREKKGIEVNCNTLDKFIHDNNIEKIDFLKANIEGAELEMIKGMDQTIKKVRNIAISCHDFLFSDNKNIRSSVIKFLESNQFTVMSNETGNVVKDSWVYGVKK